MSQQTFTSGIQSGRQAIVELRVRGIDVDGEPISIDTAWTSTNSDVISVSPNHARGVDQVRIVVNGSGESTVTVNAEGLSKDLFVRAESVANGLGMRVSISQ